MILQQSYVTLLRGLQKNVKSFRLIAIPLPVLPVVTTDAASQGHPWWGKDIDPSNIVLDTTNEILRIDCEVVPLDTAVINPAAVFTRCEIFLEDGTFLWAENIPETLIATDSLITVRAKINFKQLCP